MVWVEDYWHAEAARELAGQVDGRHYSSYCAEVKALRQTGDDDAAAGLLLRLIDAVDREAQVPLAGCAGVPGWYFEQLATIYKKRGMLAERGLLIQRQMRLQIQAETQGRLAKLKMDAVIAAEQADDAGSGGVRIVVRQRPAVKPSRRKPGAAERTGRAAGKAVGLLARILGLK